MPKEGPKDIKMRKESAAQTDKQKTGTFTGTPTNDRGSVTKKIVENLRKGGSPQRKKD